MHSSHALASSQGNRGWHGMPNSGPRRGFPNWPLLPWASAIFLALRIMPPPCLRPDGQCHRSLKPQRKGEQKSGPFREPLFPSVPQQATSTFSTGALHFAHQDGAMKKNSDIALLRLPPYGSGFTAPPAINFEPCCIRLSPRSVNRSCARFSIRALAILLVLMNWDQL